MDQCKHCIARGDIKACRETKCSIHDSWYSKQMRLENNSLKETLGRIVGVKKVVQEMSSLVKFECNPWCVSASTMFSHAKRALKEFNNG